MGLDPPVHMRPPEPDPLRVDVINGWPLSQYPLCTPIQIPECIVVTGVTPFNIWTLI